MVQIVERTVPSQGVVQVPVIGFRRVTVHTTGSGITVWQFCRHVIAVVEPLQARCDVKLVGESIRQCYLSIKDGVQHCVTFLKTDILLLEMIVVTTIGRIACTGVLLLTSVGGVA